MKIIRPVSGLTQRTRVKFSKKKLPSTLRINITSVSVDARSERIYQPTLSLQKKGGAISSQGPELLRASRSASTL